MAVLCKQRTMELPG